MTDTVTTFRDGKFTTQTQPDWWQEEVDRLFPLDADRLHPGYAYGLEDGNQVEAWNLLHGRGHFAFMSSSREIVELWLPETADLLDFLTTRAPAFVGLSEGRPLTKSLQTLTAAFVSYARHGQGEHIDLLDGESVKDADERYPCRA